MKKQEITQAVGLMIRTLRSHRCQCERQIGRLGVHHSQHRLLMNIARSKIPPTQKELADKLGVSAAAISNAIKRLEADGYVVRESVGDDMGKNTVALTDKGIKITEKSKGIFEDIDNIWSKWEQKQKKLAFYIEHDELEKVHTSIVKMKSYVENENFSEAMAELEEGKFVIEHIQEKNSFNYGL